MSLLDGRDVQETPPPKSPCQRVAAQCLNSAQEQESEGGDQRVKQLIHTAEGTRSSMTPLWGGLKEACPLSNLGSDFHTQQGDQIPR